MPSSIRCPNCQTEIKLGLENNILEFLHSRAEPVSVNDIELYFSGYSRTSIRKALGRLKLDNQIINRPYGSWRIKEKGKLK